MEDIYTSPKTIMDNINPDGCTELYIVAVNKLGELQVWGSYDAVMCAKRLAQGIKYVLDDEDKGIA